MEYGEGLAKLESRAKLAKGLLWAFAVVAAFTAIGEVMEASGSLNIDTDAGPLVLAVALVYIAYFLAFVFSVVLVALWIHRGHANLGDVGVDALEFTPGWAVGWYFIPFANLVQPFKAMRELWNASHAESDHYGAPAPTEVKVWWAAWIVGNILTSVGSRILEMGEGGTNSLMVGNMINAVGTAGLAVSAVLLTKIIGAVTKAQRDGVNAGMVFA